jgi:Undecaprenyl-phosphate galactose phosphotransferase WbaP
MSAAAVEVRTAGSTHKATQRIWLTTLSLVTADLIAVALARVITLLIVRSLGGRVDLLSGDLKAAFSALLMFALLGVYRIGGLNPAGEFRGILLGTSAAYMITAGVTLLRHNFQLDVAAGVILAWTLSFPLLGLIRATLRGVCGGLPWWGAPTVIFGAGEMAREIARTLQLQPGLGLKIVGAFDDGFVQWPEARRDVYVGRPHLAANFAQSRGISHAIIAMPSLRGFELEQFIREHARPFKHLVVVPDVSGVSSVWVEPRDLGGILGLQVSQTLAHTVPQLFKRCFDIAATAAAGVLLAPALAMLYIAVRLSSPGPVFYGQVRQGRGNQPFRAWKFRTMYANADEVLAHHLATNEELRKEWERDFKLRNDPRVTPVGRFLRKTSLDELPQLWNVFRGDMSIVGPRPIVKAEIPRYGAAFDAYQSVRPGITGMWQVSGRNNTTYAERVRWDCYYVRNWSVWLDLYIIGRTFKTVFFGEGAY